MATQYIKVSTDRLGEDIVKIREYMDSMKTHLETLQEGIKQLNTMWEGSSKQQFMEQCQKDIEQLSKVIGEMEMYYNFQVYAKRKYEQCEDYVAQIVQSIHI